jgi:hypothetical protein
MGSRAVTFAIDQPVPGDPREHWRMSRLWLRLAAVALGGLALLLLASRSIGTRFEPVLAIAVAAPIAVCLVLAHRRWWARLIAQAIVLAGVCVGAALIGGGEWVDGFAGVLEGGGQMLSTEWPTPQWVDVIVTLTALIGVTVALAAETSLHRRWRAMPALPLVLAFIALLSVSAPAGPQWSALLALVVAVFALLLIGDARKAVAPTRVVLEIGMLAVALLAVAGTVTFAERADPRSVRAASRTFELVDPVARSSEERELTSPVELYRVTGSDLPETSLWRSAGLDAYNGETWSASGSLLPAGSSVSTDSPRPNASVSITMLEPAGEILPTPGTVLRTDDLIEVDRDRRVVRVIDQARPLTVQLLVEPSSPLADDDQLVVAVEPPNEIESSFASLAVGFAPAGDTITDRVNTIANELRSSTFELVDDGGGPSVQLGLIDRFLRKDRRGSEAQFITGFVLLARSIGAEARVAVGYDVRLVDGSGSIATSDARTWAEVQTVDGSWRSIEVVPDDSTVAPEVPAEEIGGLSGLPDQPPPAAEPELTVDEDDTVREATDDAAARATWLSRALRLGAQVVGLGVVLPLLVIASVILLIKAMRRTGLRAGDPTRQVLTAWTLAADALVDAGAQLRTSTTNQELVAIGSESHPSTAAPLQALKQQADESLFSAAGVDADTGIDAVSQLREVERALVASSSWVWRARWTLSTRSLRRSTRSPLRQRNVKSNSR